MVGLGVGMIFHPLADELDTSLSQKIEFKFRVTHDIGVVLPFIVTLTYVVIYF